VTAAVLFLDNAIGAAFRGMQRQLIVLFCTAILIFLLGLVDDLRGLPARFKLAVELLAAGTLYLFGVRIDHIAVTDNLVLHLGAWGCLLTLLWVVGITNAVNLSDGLDGLAAGISAIACGVIATFAISRNSVMMAVFMLGLLGSLSGFLVFNFNPAKIFMGDCGSLFLGFTIAASSVVCTTKAATLVGLALPALALGVPIFDTFFSMLRRFLERRSLFAPDRSHFHHRLLELGLHQRHAVVMIYLVTLLAAGFGLFMLIRDDLGSLVIFSCVLLLLVLLFHVVGAVHLKTMLLSLQQRRCDSRREYIEKRTFENLQLRFRQVHDTHEWWQVICEAAQQFELAWISVHIVNRDGTTSTSVWRGQPVLGESSRIITVSVPVAVDGGQTQFELAVLVNGSLESAAHRATLFSPTCRQRLSSVTIE
jgi:UDP-GlcNAc:undecaprenyl-phosphate GlcNAc-1-phosphate transferase